MAASISDPAPWTTTHRTNHPVVVTAPSLATVVPISTGISTTVTDVRAHAPPAQPKDAIFTCFLCSRHGTRDAQLYSVLCNCPLESRRSLHRSCAVRIGEKHSDDDIRCRMCSVKFEMVVGKSSALLFWRDVLCGTTAGFAQPFIVLLYIILFLKISDIRYLHEDTHNFLEYIHFWVVPIVSFVVWSVQRILMEHILPWRFRWLRFAKPWSGIVVRTVIPIAGGLQPHGPSLFGPTPDIPPLSVSWRRLTMALCCDVGIMSGTLWVNYHFAPIPSVPYSPFFVLFLSFVFAIAYAKVFRKLSNSIRLGEQRPRVLEPDASLATQLKEIITEL